MIVVTGAAGFIASNLVSALNNAGYFDLVLVDDFSRKDRIANYEHKRFSKLVERSDFPQFLTDNQLFVQYVFHLGARTDTAEFDVDLLNKLNLDYTKSLWNICVEFGIPFLYASSAATYGGGELGFSDEDDTLSPKLKPLNPYGISKNDFDIWALKQENKPSQWVGLKFFNVYGPNEYHKGRMASVVFHAYNQIFATGGMKLFKSHNPAYVDGGQMRDFVFVNDLCNMMLWLMENRNVNGIFNAGSGKARTFKDLAISVFKALDLEPNITFVETPEDIRDKYQYFTEAKMDKIKDAGYASPFTTLENGIEVYVNDYLRNHVYA